MADRLSSISPPPPSSGRACAQIAPVNHDRATGCFLFGLLFSATLVRADFPSPTTHPLSPLLYAQT